MGKDQTFQQNQLGIQAIQQMQEMMNIMFSLGQETSIRHLSIKNSSSFALLMRGENKYSSEYQGSLQIMLSPRTPLSVSLQDIHDVSFSKQMKSNNNRIIDSFNTHLDEFRNQNQIEVNLAMKEKLEDSTLSNLILSKVTDLSDYIYIRKEMAYSYSSTMFFNYFLGNSLKLADIYIDYSRGIASTVCNNVQISQNNRISIKNVHCIRLSRNITTYLGELSILGLVAPTFISMAKAITQPKYAMKEICALFLNEMLIANGIKELISSEMFGEQLKQLYDKILWLYVEDLNNTWTKSTQHSSEVTHSETDPAGENAHKSNNIQSRTNNGYVDPIYPRSYTILETIQSNQLHNGNSLHYQYWF